jgi:LacI family transcriptional regulator
MTSIKDVAAKAKVSIGTVDRVLHNRGRVSEKTRARVERIVRRLGYRPNIHARSLSLDKAYRFAVVMPRLTQDSEYWKFPAKGIDKACRELESHHVSADYYLFDRYSDVSFERAFQGAVKSKPDGLLIAPVLSGKAGMLVPTIPQGTPYVFFDSTIPGTECLTFIGQDPFQSGLLAASLLQSVSGGQGHAAIVKVTPDDFHITERIRGFLAGMEENKRMPAHLFEVDSHGGEIAFAGTVRRIVQELDPLAGIVVSNAWTHSVAHAVRAHAKPGRIAVIGYDLVPKNLQYLEEGVIGFLISQCPSTQGYEGIYSLYEHVVLRESVEQTIMVPIDIVTKENVKYYQG